MRPPTTSLPLQGVTLLLFLSVAGGLSGQATTASAPPGVEEEGTLQFVDLGTCPTLSGELVGGCRLGYRTRGRLNEARTNAVLIPSWYGGTSADLERLVGADAMVDPADHYVIMVDALGNGVSTSPSNSPEQPGASFPRLAAADLVAAQRRLVHDHLEIPRLHAVVGFSMGGFQALEWGVRHPAEAGRIVSLLGSARPGTHDRYVYRSLMWALELPRRAGLPADSVGIPMATLWHTVRNTPGMEDAEPADSIDATLAREAPYWGGDFDPEDNRLQLQLLMGHDVAVPFDGDLHRAAAAIRGPLLMVVSPDDLIVSSSGPAAFGASAGAEVMSVPSPCGHFALYCEPGVATRVRAFLREEGPPTPSP